jgi:hypothetical protein
MDTALNNRQSSNPYEPSRNKGSRVVYPPTGLLAKTGKTRVQLTWNAANSDEHLRYQIDIRSIVTGAIITKSSYTNGLVWTGTVGDYEAIVKSVGRDGASSPIEKITFSLNNQTMNLEGAKHGPTELGTRIQDDVTLVEGFSVFVWGSLVLDKYAAGSSNNPIILKLWSMEGPAAVWDEEFATLQQAITLYPATESAADLDGNARGGSISRPETVRSGSFETSQSVMFEPLDVPNANAGEVWTFFLEATNRDIEDDEVALSMVIWGGFKTVGEIIPPTDPWTSDVRNAASYTGKNETYGLHKNSFLFKRKAFAAGSVTDGSWMFTRSRDDLHNVIGNTWTVAMWFRPNSTRVPQMVSEAEVVDGVTGLEDWEVADTTYLFNRQSYDGSTDDVHFNNVQIWYTGSGVDPDFKHEIHCKVTNADNSEAITASFEADSTLGTDYQASPMFLNGANTAIVNSGWCFLVVCFEGGPNTNNGSKPKIRMYLNNRGLDTNNPTDGNMVNAANQMTCLNQFRVDGAEWYVDDSGVDMPNNLTNSTLFQDQTRAFTYSDGLPDALDFIDSGVYKGDDFAEQMGSVAIFETGMWNVAIDSWTGEKHSPLWPLDTEPFYDVDNPGAPLTLNPGHTDGRADSMASIHYLFNQGYGADIDWLKNSNYGGFVPGFGYDASVETTSTSEQLGSTAQGGGVNEWGGAAHAFACWIKPFSETPDAGADLGIMDFCANYPFGQRVRDYGRKTIKIDRDGSQKLTLQITIYDKTDNLKFVRWNYTTGSTNMSSVGLTLNEWNFVAYSYDESKGTIPGKITVWVNGNPFSPSSTSGDTTTETNSEGFGSYTKYTLKVGATNSFHGASWAIVDNQFNARWHRAGLWKEKLTQTMINYLYNSGNLNYVDWLAAASSGAYDEAMAETLYHYYAFGENQADDTVWSWDTGHVVGIATALPLTNFFLAPLVEGDPDLPTTPAGTFSTTQREYPFAENLISLWQWGSLPEDAFTTEGNAMRDWGHFAYRGDLNRSREIEPVASGKSSNSWGATTTVVDILSPLTLAWDTDTPGTGFVEAEGTIADDGSTRSAFSYPGQGFRSVSEAQGGNDVNRPDTTDGVLDEPKTYNDGADTERQGSYP